MRPCNDEKNNVLFIAHFPFEGKSQTIKRRENMFKEIILKRQQC